MAGTLAEMNQLTGSAPFGLSFSRRLVWSYSNGGCRGLRKWAETHKAS